MRRNCTASTVSSLAGSRPPASQSGESSGPSSHHIPSHSKRTCYRPLLIILGLGQPWVVVQLLRGQDNKNKNSTAASRALRPQLSGKRTRLEAVSEIMRSYDGKDKRAHVAMTYESRHLLTKRDLQNYYRYYNTSKYRGQMKKCAAVVVCVCLCSYLLLDYSLKSHLMRQKDHFSLMDHINAEGEAANGTPAYFVDTPGCRMPYFPVSNEIILQYMAAPDPIVCGPTAIMLANQAAHSLSPIYEEFGAFQTAYNVSATDWAGVRCAYQELRRVDEGNNELSSPQEFQLRPYQSVALDRAMEFVRVQCFAPHDADVAFHTDYHIFFVPKDSSSAAPANISAVKPPVAPPAKEAAEERLSVMVLGIDTLSHLNFLRQMERSVQFVRRRPHIELWGYNKVGDNTFPNMIPVLTGLEPDELNQTCGSLAGARFDSCPFIWRRYKEAGYATISAEDSSRLSLFYEEPTVLGHQPTDYYPRAVISAMENEMGFNKRGNMLMCLGSRRPIDVIQQYVGLLTPLMRSEDFFALFWSSSMTHDFFNMPSLLDDDLVRLLEHLAASGVTNKTMIFLMSDHGLRYGYYRQSYQGMIEERQPLFVMLPPPWFGQRYPAAVRNFHTNARRLTTHFDLHATLVDLLDARKLTDAEITRRSVDLNESVANDALPRGISLFLPVPVTRTCEQAGIAGHWCTCYERTYLPTNDGRVQRAARYIVQLINARLRLHPQCRRLYLNSIVTAMVGAPHHKISKQFDDKHYSSDYTMRLQTKPGLAEFEATVRMSPYAISLTGSISRLNLYSSESYCIDDAALKVFCYCRR